MRDEPQDAKLAKNEALFRELNENIAGVASTFGSDAPFEFVCECAIAGCFERLTLRLAQYRGGRGHGSHFLRRAWPSQPERGQDARRA